MFDDAVWSLGEHIITWLGDGEQLRIVTVFGGVPGDPKGYAKHSTLNAEHAAVCEKLGVESVMLPFFDSVYRPRPSEPVIESALSDLGVEGRVIAPIGIHHDDHDLTARVCAWVWGGDRIEMYDELPYYALYPEQAYRNYYGQYERSGYTSNIAGKKEICRMYASQMVERDEVERCLYLPERHWVSK